MSYWGVDLFVAAQKSFSIIPTFIEKLFECILENFIEIEGIFQNPGDNRVIQNIIKEIRDTNIFIPPNGKSFELCSVINKYLSSIPNHLLIDQNSFKIEKIKTITDAKEFFNCLPLPNQALFSRLFGFFKLLLRNPKNKLTPQILLTKISQYLIERPGHIWVLHYSICEIFLNNYFEIFSNILSITEEFNWIKFEDFNNYYKNLIEYFFIQSLNNNNQKKLKKTIYENKKITKNIKINDELSWKVLISKLLED